MLTYEGAEITPRDAWTLAKIARTTKHGWRYESDLHFHELDRAEDGCIAHRLLFHPGVWFEIRCRELRWKQVSRPGREFPRLPDRFPGGPGRAPRPVGAGRFKAEPPAG